MKIRRLNVVALMLALLLALGLPAMAEGIREATGLEPVAHETGLTTETGTELIPEDGEASLEDVTAGEELERPEFSLEPGTTPENADPAGNAIAESGYVTIAEGARGYADAALTDFAGTFVQDALAYGEPCPEQPGSVLVFFDIQEARNWGDDIPSCYVSARDVLPHAPSDSRGISKSASGRAHDGFALPCVSFAAEASETTALELDTAVRTQADIQSYVDAHPICLSESLYSSAATREPYVPSKLSEYTLRAAVGMVNRFRYIAGLNADVGLDWEQEDNLAAAAFINGLNYGLSHYPDRPAVLADPQYDELYAQACQGARTSNLYGGREVVGSVSGYVSDIYNVISNNVGHRLWVLSATMGKTMFGGCDALNWCSGKSGMYAFDSSADCGCSMMAWPARETPIQYYTSNTNWSFSIRKNSDFTLSDFKAGYVGVRLVRQSDGRIWNFSKSSSDGFFDSDHDTYGGWPGTVVFRPDGLDSLSAGDVFNVVISNSRSDREIRYTVRFFDLDLSGSSQPKMVYSVDAAILSDGNHVFWNTVDDALGYMISRATDGNGYALYAQLPADAQTFVDTAVSEGHVYSYKVQAYNAAGLGYGSAKTAHLPAPTKVTISPAGTSQLYVRENLQMQASVYPEYAETTLTWSSSNESVAAVDQNGLVTAVSAGVTQITVTTDNGVSRSVKVKVLNVQPKKVKLNKSGTVKLKKGKTLKLKATLMPDYAVTKLKWSSSNKRVAKVSAQGVVTAVRPGTAVITVKTANGKTAKVKIQVPDTKK